MGQSHQDTDVPVVGNEEDFAEELKTKDDPINEMSNFDIEQEEKEKQQTGCSRKTSQDFETRNVRGMALPKYETPEKYRE